MNKNNVYDRKVCLVGIGSHMQKKLIPALKSLNIKIDSYVSSTEKPILFSSHYFSCLKKAIKVLPKEILFIVASPPSLHYEQIKLISNNGFDVFIEKPAFLSLEQFKVIKRIVDTRKIIIFESLMYLENNIVKKIITKYSKNKNRIVSINTNFIIPSFAEGSYRNNSNFEDSLFTDMICYPISFLVELGFRLDINNFSYSISRKKTKTIFRLKFIVGKTELEFSFGEGEYYKNNFLIKLENNNELECFPFFYGREGFRTVIYRNSKREVKKNYLENNCFEKLFQHSRDYWLQNQSSRLKNLKKVTSIIEQISKEIKEY